MTNINISIKKEAHEFLKSLKSDNKSFSDVIIEFKESVSERKGSKEAVLKFFGALKDLGIDWEEKERRMKNFREDFEKSINDRIRHNSNN